MGRHTENLDSVESVSLVEPQIAVTASVSLTRRELRQQADEAAVQVSPETVRAISEEVPAPNSVQAPATISVGPPAAGDVKAVEWQAADWRAPDLRVPEAILVPAPVSPPQLRQRIRGSLDQLVDSREATEIVSPAAAPVAVAPVAVAPVAATPVAPVAAAPVAAEGVNAPLRLADMFAADDAVVLEVSRRASRSSSSFDSANAPKAGKAEKAATPAKARKERHPTSLHSVAPPSRTASSRPASSRPSQSQGKDSLKKSRLATRLVTVTAMVFVAAIAVATSVPANALLSSQDVESLKSVHQQQENVTMLAAGQSVDGSGGNVIAGRDSVSVTGSTPVKAFTDVSSNRITPLVPNSTNPILWPFPQPVNLTDAYGPRAGMWTSGGYTGNFHTGQDFDPGYGTPIRAVADGIVTEVSSSLCGQAVVISHNVNGQKFDSEYCHMIYGSPGVSVGQSITAGTVIGNVGQTGMATGPHLHLEIHIDGNTIDPLSFLRSHSTEWK